MSIYLNFFRDDSSGKDRENPGISGAKLFELPSSYLDLNPQLTAQCSPCCDEIYVPDIVLSTVDIPPEIEVVGNGTIVQSR